MTFVTLKIDLAARERGIHQLRKSASWRLLPIATAAQARAVWRHGAALLLSAGWARRWAGPQGHGAVGAFEPLRRARLHRCRIGAPPVDTSGFQCCYGGDNTTVKKSDVHYQRQA